MAQDGEEDCGVRVAAASHLPRSGEGVGSYSEAPPSWGPYLLL